jgi:hypothetical protein
VKRNTRPLPHLAGDRKTHVFSTVAVLWPDALPLRPVQALSVVASLLPRHAVQAHPFCFEVAVAGAFLYKFVVSKTVAILRLYGLRRTYLLSSWVVIACPAAPVCISVHGDITQPDNSMSCLWLRALLRSALVLIKHCWLQKCT